MEEQSTIYQYLAAFVVCILTIGGCSLSTGWTSPMVALFTSNETPLLFGKITIEEASWMVALRNIGSLVGCVLFGFITKISRKWSLICTAIPIVVSWSLVVFAGNVFVLYGARFIDGFGIGALIITAPILITEIADKRIRGILTMIIVTSNHVGELLGSILGIYCSFYTTHIVVIVSVFAFAVIFSFFPETPVNLIKRNRILDAEKSIRFYCNFREKDSDSVHLEIDRLRAEIIDIEFKKSLDGKLSWSDFKTKQSIKALTIGVVLVILYTFCGYSFFMHYSTTIFDESGSSISSNMSTITVNFIQVIGGLVVIYFVDKMGRRLTYVLSTVPTLIGLIIFGLYNLLKSWNYEVETYNWITIASLSIIIFFASIGIIALPFVIIAEIMPERMKEFGVTLCMTLLSLLGFIPLKCYPFFIDTIGMHGSAFLFAGISLSCFLFIIRFLPETKGKSHDEIMKSLQ